MCDESSEISKRCMLTAEKVSSHYENMPIQIYTENFTAKKMKIFR